MSRDFRFALIQTNESDKINVEKIKWEFTEVTPLKVRLEPLKPKDRNQFISDNQTAFNFGALEEFGRRDDHFEEDGEIISRETIEKSIDAGGAYRIMLEDETVGGVVIKVADTNGELELLFVSPNAHSKGIGYAAWCEVERMHPEVKT